MPSFFSAFTRRKTVSFENDSPLARVLTLLDLTGLGVGGTLGLGVYILAGQVARTVAGPAVCISFLVAAIASAFAGLCYAEFAARVPKAGSAYVYSYVTVGELAAFVIGWNLVLEYVIGTASVARGLSAYIDELTGQKIATALTEWSPINVSFMSPYPDWLSLGFVCLLTALLCFGVKESTTLNNIFTILNLLTVITMIVSGAIKADPYNWNIKKEDIPDEFKDHAGNGGFMPFGFAGIMAGAAKCFYGFVGFDGVATTGEEAKQPQRDIPLAIVFSLLIVFLAYFGVSSVLTLMWPYYDQNPSAPFPYVFDKIGWISVKWIVTVGAIFALCTSLLGAMFPLPRVIYAMANDGIIFKFLSKVSPTTKTPILATILSGILSAAMAALFNLDQLVDMMSIGTLLAYTIVAVCVLILRYQPSNSSEYMENLEIKPKEVTLFCYFKLFFNLNGNKYPNGMTTTVTNWCICLFSVFAIGFCAFFIHGFDVVNGENPHYVTLFAIITIIMLILIIIIYRQPVDNAKLSFRVPWVPFLPCLSVITNLYLMLQLDVYTWIRFAIWLVIGFMIYFFYGLKHSEEKQKTISTSTITSTATTTTEIVEQTKI